MEFHVLINDVFSVITEDSNLNPIDNKKVLSILNDFENGVWRSDKFHKFIWNNIKDTALSSRERKALIDEGEDSVLTEAAKKLRLSESPDDIGKGSEIAEILLYGLMKKYYRALPIVPKIFYKQNRQDNAKGADSVHIVIEDEQNFSLWLGESKFYNSIDNSRLSSIINSVKDSLSLEKLKKENSIITSVSEINEFQEISDDLRSRIINTLSQKTSIDHVKSILNVPILLLHECTLTKNETHLTADYLAEVKRYHKERATAYFKKQIEECSSVDLYSTIKFHIILFPVPEKEPIVDKFILKAQSYRD